jgi:hypothetical protein
MYEAKINADNWLFLLPDTIHLMRNGCDRDYTAFEEREIITPNSTALLSSRFSRVEYFTRSKTN